MSHPLFCCSILLMLLISSCGVTDASYQAECPGKPIKLQIAGKRSTGVEPFKVELKVKAYGFKEGSLHFELYSDDLNEKTIQIDWLEDGARITFTQRDGTQKFFKLIATPDQLSMAEVTS